eukprot:CAMPEP_0180404084 /NCGR_PEP_ID=MMETSP0989-20121125/39792_1 /TAXON_ID=697907 /ORGANISM="non described non described, Strain CCMP2293" /LENGTH=267 /DNA_ID=CAMNT_0022407407 /DNA_START=57 /DNA_END=857 /DNA_ORIENTATION=-
MVAMLYTTIAGQHQKVSVGWARSGGDAAESAWQAVERDLAQGMDLEGKVAMIRVLLAELHDQEALAWRVIASPVVLCGLASVAQHGDGDAASLAFAALAQCTATCGTQAAESFADCPQLLQALCSVAVRDEREDAVDLLAKLSAKNPQFLWLCTHLIEILRLRAHHERNVRRAAFKGWHGTLSHARVTPTVLTSSIPTPRPTAPVSLLLLGEILPDHIDPPAPIPASRSAPESEERPLLLSSRSWSLPTSPPRAPSSPPRAPSTPSP